MQLLILALVFGLFTAEVAQTRADPELSNLTILIAALLPKVLIGLMYWGACVAGRKRLGKPGGHFAMRWVEYLSEVYRWSIIALYLFDLFHWGMLDLLRMRWGLTNIVLVDEVLMMAPSLLMLGWGWWAYYPLDRRIRQAILIRRVDEGQPIYPVWTRGQYLLAQFRHHVALMLVPLLLLIGWQEAVQIIVPHTASLLAINLQIVLVLVGVGCVFLFAPTLILMIWDTIPLPQGSLRERLIRMCQMHRVGVRELILWRTFGGMINGAVMGLIAPLRYILLTDALLDHLPQPQIEAVMAHELAHVRRHHLPWLMLAAIAMLGMLNLITVELMLMGERWAHTGELPTSIAALLADRPTMGALAFGLALVGWAPVFGWVSRRFERQADTFAVQHLARDKALYHDDAGRPLVDHESAATMASALAHVAELNNIPVARKSWRHGAIQWRIDYLRSLVGQPIDDLEIDRVVARIKIGALALLCLLLFVQLWWGDELPILLF